MKIKVYYDAGSSMELSDIVFHDYPKFKHEIEILSVNTMAQLNTLKFKKVTANETGTDPEKMNWLLTTKINDIDKIKLLKDDDTLIAQGVIDEDGDIMKNNVDHSISIKLIGHLADGLDEDVTYSCSVNDEKSFSDIVSDIHTDYLVPLGITASSKPTEENWETVRPVDIVGTALYPFYMYNNYYAVDWNGLKLKEVLRQICIMGNCRIIIKGITMQVKLNILIGGESATTPDGKLVITKEPMKKPDESSYEIDENTEYNLKIKKAYGDNSVTAAAHDKGQGDIDSIWEDEEENRWKLIGFSAGDKINFEHYPDNPPDEPGYEMPDSGTLTHVSGATNTDDIVFSESEVIYTYIPLGIQTIIDAYYDLDSYMQFYHLEGLNSNIEAGEIFTHDSIDMQATIVERDLRFIEGSLQPVSIIAVDKE